VSSKPSFEGSLGEPSRVGSILSFHSGV